MGHFEIYVIFDPIGKQATSSFWSEQLLYPLLQGQGIEKIEKLTSWEVIFLAKDTIDKVKNIDTT